MNSWNRHNFLWQWPWPPFGPSFCSMRTLMFPSYTLLLSFCFLTWKIFVPSNGSCFWGSGILLSKKPSWPALLWRTGHHGDVYTSPSLFITIWQLSRGFMFCMHPSTKLLSTVNTFYLFFFLFLSCLSIVRVSSRKGWAHSEYSVTCY